MFHLSQKLVLIKFYSPRHKKGGFKIGNIILVLRGYNIIIHTQIYDKIIVS